MTGQNMWYAEGRLVLRSLGGRSLEGASSTDSISHAWLTLRIRPSFCSQAGHFDELATTLAGDWLGIGFVIGAFFCNVGLYNAQVCGPT